MTQIRPLAVGVVGDASSEDCGCRLGVGIFGGKKEACDHVGDLRGSVGGINGEANGGHLWVGVEGS